MTGRRPTTYAELADVLDRLGQLIYEARRARGLDLRAAATQAGVPFNTLSRLERRTAACSLDNAIAVLLWLDTTTEQPELARSRP